MVLTRIRAQGRSPDLFLLILLALLVLDRVLLLNTFSTAYTGNDDTVYWLAAQDFSQGIFREPYFYGQNYGYMFEALLAVPFLWSGMPHFVALPLATSIVALFPFVYLSWLFWRNGSLVAAGICLLVPLALPIEHGILTGMSRGFVSGLPFAALLAPCLFRPEHRSSFVLFGLVAPLAYFINHNTAPMVVLVGGYMMLKAPFKPVNYLLVVLLALPFIGLDLLAKQFYVDHPHYVAHWLSGLHFSWREMLVAWQDLDRFFLHLGPFIWSAGWIWLIILVVLSIYTWRQDSKWSFMLIVAVLSLLALLGVEKVRDGCASIFHSRERMFLVFPLIIALGVAWSVRWIRSGTPTWSIALLALGLACVGIKSGSYSMVVRVHTATEDQGPVAIVPIVRLQADCEWLASYVHQLKADVVVMVPDGRSSSGMMATRSYGCSVLQPDIGDLFLVTGERRTWMYVKQTTVIPTTVLLYGRSSISTKAMQDHDLYRLNDDLVLIQKNTLPLKALLSDLGIDMKRHPYE